MNDSSKQAIRMWSSLRKENALPNELDVEPGDVIASLEIQEKVKKAFDEKRKQNKMWAEVDKKAEQLESIVSGVLSKISSKIEKEIGIPFWLVILVQ